MGVLNKRTQFWTEEKKGIIRIGLWVLVLIIGVAVVAAMSTPSVLP